MKRTIALLATSICLTACATTEGYRQRTEQLIGYDADILLVEWGSPVSRDRLSDGSEVWTYFEEEYRVRDGYYRTIPRERRVTFIDEEGNERTRIEQYEDTVYEPPEEYYTECETRFIIRDSVISDFRFEGNGCRATEIY